MHTYYKCVRLDGTDFFTGTVRWAPPEGHEGEWIVRHPTSTEIGADASSCLSVSTVPTDCVGMRWPCRLYEVEAVGDVRPGAYFRHKVVGIEFRTVREVDSHIALGPQGEHVAALIDRSWRLTDAETDLLRATWYAPRSAARDAARDAAWIAAQSVTWAAARDAAWAATWAPDWDADQSGVWAAGRDTAKGLLVRDLISTEHYDALTRPWRTVIGAIHPDDLDIREGLIA